MTHSDNQFIHMAYCKSLKEATEYFEQNHQNALSNSCNGYQREAIFGIFLRIQNLCKSLLKLHGDDDFQVVGIIARTVFELYLDVEYLSSNNVTEELLEKFNHFTEINNYRRAKNAEEFIDRNESKIKKIYFPKKYRQELLKNKDYSEIRRKAIGLWGHKKDKPNKPDWPSNWKGETLSRLSQMLGIDFESEYLELYSILSNYSHSGNSCYKHKSSVELFAVQAEFTKYIYEKYIHCLERLLSFFELNISKKIIDFGSLPNKLMIDVLMR